MTSPPGPLKGARPRDAGVYHLLLHLGKNRRIAVGALGRADFPAGWYTYTGRAMRGLAARLARHSRPGGKRRHWHIDHFRRRAALVGIRVVPAAAPEEECRLARRLLCGARKAAGEAAVPLPGFGSSDCRCPAHLIYWGGAPPAMTGSAWGTPWGGR